MSEKRKLNKQALAVSIKKTARLRLETVGGFKERPAETVKSALNRGFRTAGDPDGLEYILGHAIRYYLDALPVEVKP